MICNIVFFLLVLYIHFEQLFACDLVHIMQSNAHIFTCDGSTALPVNCTIFWTNNILSFCISNSFVSTNYSSSNLTNFTNTGDFNNFIPPMFPTPTTPLPYAPPDMSNTSTTTMSNTSTTTMSMSQEEFRGETDYLPWVVSGICILMFLIFGAIWCGKTKRKNSVLPLFNEKRQRISKTKIVALKNKPPVPNKYLHAKENSSTKPEFSFEEVVQLKRMLSKKKKKQKMKKYVQRLRVLPPIIKSKKVTPSKNVFLVDHSWKPPPST